MYYIANMLDVHVDSAFVHTYAQTEPIATSTSHFIATDVPVTNLLTKFGIYAIYAKYLTCTCGCMQIYFPH